MLLFPAAFGRRAVPRTLSKTKQTNKRKKPTKQKAINKLELSSQTSIKGSRDFCKSFHYFFKICVIEVQLTHNVVLISAVQQKDLVTHIHTLFFIFIFFFRISLLFIIHQLVYILVLYKENAKKIITTFS